MQKTANSQKKIPFKSSLASEFERGRLYINGRRVWLESRHESLMPVSAIPPFCLVNSGVANIRVLKQTRESCE